MRVLLGGMPGSMVLRERAGRLDPLIDYARSFLLLSLAYTIRSTDKAVRLANFSLILSFLCLLLMTFASRLSA